MDGVMISYDQPGIPQGQVGLVLPGDENIPDLPLSEGRGGAPRSSVQDCHILIELADEFPG